MPGLLTDATLEIGFYSHLTSREGFRAFRCAVYNLRPCRVDAFIYACDGVSSLVTDDTAWELVSGDLDIAPTDGDLDLRVANWLSDIRDAGQVPLLLVEDDGAVVLTANDGSPVGEPDFV